MKKLALIIVLFSGVVLTAQRHEGKRNGMKDLDSEQMATLQTKKMTLNLDLNETQQKEVKTLLLSEADFRKSKMARRNGKKEEENRPSKDERFAMQNERLDRMIALKTEMKKILTETQFEKWEKMQHRRQKGKGDRKERKSKR
jgi:hypothetical protein